MDKVKLDDIEKVVEPLFSYWNSTRQEGESFGSFTNRTVSGFFCMLILFLLVIQSIWKVNHLGFTPRTALKLHSFFFSKKIVRSSSEQVFLMRPNFY